MATATFRISRHGMGNFLCPPGDPQHRYSISEWEGSREVGSYSLGSVAPWMPDRIRERVSKLQADAVRVESPLWVASVYGYFRTMYAIDGQPWTDARDLVNGELVGHRADWHAAVVYVRKYFPDHAPRLDLISDPGKGYGSYPCLGCGQRVQYCADHDAYVVFQGATACPDGLRHRIE